MAGKQVGAVLTAALVVSGTLARAQELDRFQVQQVHVDLPLVTMYFDLPDVAGRAVPGVEARNLAVVIGARAPRVVDLRPFDANDEGVAYIILIDVSGTMKTRLNAVREALSAWIDSLGSRDQMALVAFGDGVRPVADFTTDKNRLRAALDALAATEDHTALYRALLKALQLGGRRDAALPFRRVIVVFSDGKDEDPDPTTRPTEAALFEEIEGAHIPIYAIGAMDRRLRQTDSNLRFLADCAHRSAGVYVSLDQGGAVKDVYATLREAIRRVYVARLCCEECQADGQSYNVKVTISHGTSMRDEILKLPVFPASLSPASVRELCAAPVARVPLWKKPWLYAALLLAVGAAVALTLLARRSTPEPPAEPPPPPPPPPPPEPPPGLRGLPLRFTVVGRKGASHTYRALLESRIVVGSGPSCDTRIANDASIEDAHCALSIVNGVVFVEDLQTSAGTAVNGVPIHGRFRLESGNTIRVGHTELRVVFEEGRSALADG